MRGFVINKFRGDATLLESGLRWLEARYGLPVVGTLPYFHDVELLEEDAVPQRLFSARSPHRQIHIEVISLPRISNFTDFSPLEREPGVQLRYIDRPPDESLPDCLILPGSKSTIADLAFLREQGLDTYVQRCAAADREVLGICGGFQMLGQQILDPNRLEAAVDAAPGLGVLPVTTVFGKEKLVSQVQGIHLESGLPVAGYEIHMGQMRAEPGSSAVFTFTERGGSSAESYDGLKTADGRIWGTHLHGLFDSGDFRRWWLNRLRRRRGLPEVPSGSSPCADGVYDRLAEAVRPHLNLEAVYHMLWS